MKNTHGLLHRVPITETNTNCYISLSTGRRGRGEGQEESGRQLGRNQRKNKNKNAPHDNLFPNTMLCVCSRTTINKCPPFSLLLLAERMKETNRQEEIQVALA